MNRLKDLAFAKNLKNDLPAGLVVFLVAVPLCLGIALASGAPLFSGIISGIVGGIIVTIFSKSKLGVSGPAAGLAVVVLTSINELGSFENFLLALVIAGIIQILLGIFKTGVIAYYLPSSVIKGMLSGIGVIIILKQMPHAFGYDHDPEGEMEFFQSDGHTTFSELIYMFESINTAAVVISFVSLGLIILWERPFMKKMSFTKLIPGPLLAVVAGIFINQFCSPFWPQLEGEHLVNIPIASSFSSFLSQFRGPDFGMIGDPQIYMIALTIAVVASVETLLCVEATDKLDPERRITPTNRELVAQGIGNTFSGLIGGLPITQVIVRSSANIQSGGKSRISAFFHGILILISAISIPHIINMVPLASLAAILLTVGFKLINPKIIKEMYLTGNAQFYSFVVTIFGIVFTDLLIGIGLGLIVAVVFILWNNFKTPYHFDPDEIVLGKPIRIELSEDVSFLNKAGIIKTFGLLPDEAHVIIDARRTRNIHWDVLELIMDFRLNAESRGIQLELIGFEKIESKNALNVFQRHLKSDPT